MTIRDSFDRISPPWLTKKVGRGIQWSIGLLLDAMRDKLDEGIKARMPGIGTPDALPHIGNDRLIERGPTESTASYAARLSLAFDSWQIAGSPYALLDQLRAFFLPSPPPIRVVSNGAVWHAIDPVTKVVTRTKAANWEWDALATGGAPRWWRGWVIIDSSAGPWEQTFIGDGHNIGEPGRTIGSTATTDDIASIERIVRRWKPKHVHELYTILAFSADLFLPGNASGAEMPDGTWDDDANRAPNAAYIKGVI